MAQHRAIANIERDIAGARAWLAELVREKESARRSAQMKAQRHRPDFVAKMLAGYAEAARDPERRDQWIAKKRANGLKGGRADALPPMSDRQRKYYTKIRSAGLPRIEAVEAALALEASP